MEITFARKLNTQAIKCRKRDSLSLSRSQLEWLSVERRALWMEITAGSFTVRQTSTTTLTLHSFLLACTDGNMGAARVLLYIISHVCMHWRKEETAAPEICIFINAFLLQNESMEVSERERSSSYGESNCIMHNARKLSFSALISLKCSRVRRASSFVVILFRRQ